MENRTPSLWHTAQELGFVLDIINLITHRRQLQEFHRRLRSIPCVVVPGLGSTDFATLAMRHFLSSTGMVVHKSGLRRNTGDVKELVPRVRDQLERVFLLTGQPAILVGWSLGGIIARQVARQCPEKIRGVCTMGSPIVGGGKYSAYAPIYRRMGMDLDWMETRCNEREQVPLTVPSLSIYSKRDGIVFWNACVDVFNDHTRNVEVDCRHFGMGFSPQLFALLVQWLEELDAV